MKIKELIKELCGLATLKVEVNIETRGSKGTVHARVGGNYDDEGVAVLYGVAPATVGTPGPDRGFTGRELLAHLQQGNPEKETVIESAENEYTADFEVRYINGIIFLREKQDSKPW